MPDERGMDPDLVAAAVRGDNEATNDLLAVVLPLVTRFARGRLRTYPGGHQLAEEAAQETCIAVVRALPGFVPRPGVPFAAWVQKIAAAKVTDIQRHMARRQWEVLRDPEWAVPHAGSAEHAVLAWLDVSRVHDVLRQLPPKMAHALRLRADGYDAAEVGRIIGGMTPNAVRVMQHRAMRMVAEVIHSGSGGQPDAAR